MIWICSWLLSNLSAKAFSTSEVCAYQDTASLLILDQSKYIVAGLQTVIILQADIVERLMYLPTISCKPLHLRPHDSRLPSLLKDGPGRSWCPPNKSSVSAGHTDSKYNSVTIQYTGYTSASLVRGCGRISCAVGRGRL